MSARTHIRWLGHATVLLNQADTWVITDPVLRRRVAHLWRRNPLLPQDWPERVDAVLISHMHHDHLDIPSLRRLGSDKLIFVPPGAGDWFNKKGFRNVQELRVGDSQQVEAITIRAVPAEHSGWRPPFGPTAEAIGYVVEGAHCTYFPGDTDLFAEMSSLTPDLDLALIPIWGWGPSLGEGHLDPYRAAEAVERLQPRIAVPIHWGTFQPFNTALRRAGFLVDPPHVFEEETAKLAPKTRVQILRPGGALTLTPGAEPTANQG